MLNKNLISVRSRIFNSSNLSKKLLLLLLLACSIFQFAHTSYASEMKRKLCVYDVVGANGDIFNISKDYKVAMLNHGVDFTLKPYTDDKVAAADFKSGQCDAALLPGLSVKEFNPFTGSLEAVGALPTQEHMELTFRTLAKPDARPLLINGPYEVAGILPVGTAYLFVNDRTIDTVEKLSGKRITAIEHDPSQPELINITGGSAVPATITNFASLFNNKTVDICAAPATAYGALELYKGLEPNGGVVDVPLGQITFQLITHQKNFEPEFLQFSREYIFSLFPRAISLISKANNDIASKYWIRTTEAEKNKYGEMLRQARVSLREKGILDPKALTVMRKVRCSVDQALAECTALDRE